MIDYFIFDYVNLTHGYIYLTANYFIAAGIPLLLGDFSRRPVWKRILICIAEIIGCIILMELFASIYFAIFKADGYVPFTCGFLVLVLYALVRCKKKPLTRVVHATAYFGLCCLGLSVTMSLGSLLGEPYYYLQWWLITVNGVLIFFSVFIVRYFSVEDDLMRSPVFITVEVLMNVIGVAFVIYRRARSVDPGTSLAISVILIFVNLTTYFGLSRFMKKTQENNRRLTNELLVNADKDVLRLSSENLESIREMRHELKNQYAVMKAFLDSEEYSKLREYFSEYSELIERKVNFADYGNGTINAILCIGHGKARNVGADLDCKIAVPDKLNIKDVDLCSLLMNLINNAVEYYERNEAVTDRKITVEVIKIHQTLLIKVTNYINPAHGTRALTLRTSKENKSLHGYGNKVVAFIVEKYNGSVCYEAEDGKFVAAAILCDPYEVTTTEV